MEGLLRRGRYLWQERQWRDLLPIFTTIFSLLILLWGLVWGWHDLVQYNWEFSWPPLVASSLIYALALGLSMTGWVMIMRTFHVRSTWKQDAKFFIYSWMARRLPTPAPYLASRMLLYERIGVAKRITSVGMLWENMLLIAASALLFFMLLPFTPLLNTQLRVLPALLAVVAMLPFVLRPALLARLVNWLLVRMGKEPLNIVMPPSRVALGLLIYASVWLTGGLILFLVIRAVHPLDWQLLPMVMQSWVLSGLVSYIVFFAPIGFGVRELTLAAMLSLIIPISAAIVIVLLVRVWNMGNELVWAFIMYRL
jgi:hypothetical protein